MGKRAVESDSLTYYDETLLRDCPGCGRTIEKNGGCNHMTCRACKTEFCWICRQNYKKHDLAICKGHITTDSSYLDKLRDRRTFPSLQTRMEMYRLVSYYSTTALVSLNIY